MKKIDRTVLRETAYIALCVTAMTAVVCLVFLLIGKWSTSVLLGGLLGTAVSVLNFFLMGVTVQSAVGMDDKSMQVLSCSAHLFRASMLFRLYFRCSCSR